MRTERAKTNYHAGLAAEAIVAREYCDLGHPIVQQRWRGHCGEIDLIARDGDVVIFIEVKKSRKHDAAAHRLSRRQMDRLCRAASEYVACEPHGQLTEMRFDLATVDQAGTVRVIENAFMEA